MEKLPHERALTKAKVAFMSDPKNIFSYTVCFSLEFKWSEDIPTAGVNGKQLLANPAFFMTLNKPQQVTLLAHETGHIIRLHIGRAGNRDKQLWNYAADYVINQDLKDQGYEPIPNWLQDDQYRGMSTEQVYDLLKQLKDQQPPPPQGGPGQPQPGQGDVPDRPDLHDIMPAPDDSSDIEIQGHMKDIIVSAATAATISGQPGSIPADVQVWLDGLLKPKLPLAQHLRRFFRDVQKNDYTWARPNRRIQTMYLPSQRSEALSHIAFAFDMSCSVSTADIKRYVSELVGVLRMLKPAKLTLVQFDTEIKSVDVIKSVQDLRNAKLVGRGGTRIEPVMEWAAKNKPTALMVFTDGEFYEADTKPACPVMWMIHGRSKDRFECRFGTIYRFDV